MTPIYRFLARYDRSERAAWRRRIAAACGVTEPAVWHWARGIRKPSPANCRLIEKVTKGKLTKYSLRPDVFGATPRLKQAA